MFCVILSHIERRLEKYVWLRHRQPYYLLSALPAAASEDVQGNGSLMLCVCLCLLHPGCAN